MSTKTIAFYTEYPHLFEGRLFAGPQKPGSYPVEPFRQLKSEFSSRGWLALTYDQCTNLTLLDIIVFVDLPSRPSIVRQIKSEASQAQLVLYILESPAHNIGQFNRKNYSCFDAVISYNRRTCDEQLVFWVPIPFGLTQPVGSPDSGWKDRKHLVAINTRKKAGFLCDSGYGWLHRFGVRGLGEAWSFSSHSFMTQWNGYMYDFRNSLISKVDQELPSSFFFDLYGANWDGTPLGYLERFIKRPTAIGSSKGVFDGDKFGLLSKYRYSLIVENWIGNEGYVSEKLYESLASGCIPVYWGDKSVYSLIPSDAIINGFLFGNASLLIEFLMSESQDAWTKRLQAARQFLDSPTIYPFTPEGFADRFVSIVLNSYFNKGHLEKS